jgi:hypothetical protein
MAKARMLVVGRVPHGCAACHRHPGPGAATSPPPAGATPCGNHNWQMGVRQVHRHGVR